MRTRKLYLSRDDRKIAGVCGGIAETFDIDSTLVRLLWVFVVIATGFVPGVLLYFIAVIIIPEKPEKKEEEEGGSGMDSKFAKHPLDLDSK